MKIRLILLTLFFLSSTKIFACECSFIKTVKEEIKSSNYVAVGKVLKIKYIYIPNSTNKNKKIRTTKSLNRMNMFSGIVLSKITFEISEWATQNGPFSAITQGELGEMWQSLKNNNSAYSYEDLPSNLLGVGMYIRFSQDLALGNITWYQAIKTALDEISCIEPESAPNFDYIPYIINEYYPKNYTYTPLLGEQLKQYHKQKFCERPIYEQQRTKQVHELFPR